MTEDVIPPQPDPQPDPQPGPEPQAPEKPEEKTAGLAATPTGLAVEQGSQPSEPASPPETPLQARPDLRDLLMLDVPYLARISPGGKKVAYLVQSTDWNANDYDQICRVFDLETGEDRQLVRTGDVFQVRWLDDETLGLLIDRGRGAQVYLFEGLTGEGWAVTSHSEGVQRFRFFAGGILYLANDPERAEKKKRAEKYGTYTHFEQEDSASALYYTNFAALHEYQKMQKARSEEEAKDLTKPVVELSKLMPERLKIQDFVPSPKEDAVYLNCRRRDDLVYLKDTRAYKLELDAQNALMKFLESKKVKGELVGATAVKISPEDANAEGLEVKEDSGKPGEVPAGGETAAEKILEASEKLAGEGKEAGKSSEAEEPADEGKEAGKSPETAEKPAGEDLSYLGKLIPLQLPRGAYISEVSPDGLRLLIGHQGRDDRMYTREDFWLAEASGIAAAASPEDCLGKMTNLTGALDRVLMDICWEEAGIFSCYPDHTTSRLVHFEETGAHEILDTGGLGVNNLLTASREGLLAFPGYSGNKFPEIYVFSPKSGELRQLTNYGAALEGWDLGTVETVRWKSKDGTEIEGVLRKPSNFDPARKYPLVFVVHGGPGWFSPEALISSDDLRYYPSVAFVQKEILVLKPNYRGSIGRGQAFLELNVNNLGIGDLWDLESAIDTLAEQGWVDPERVGCMGWSQGGYISAYVGLQSDRFKAVSVGAGVSDWYTYHISNDIPDFTLDYLSASPFRDRGIYERTAPISGISRAKTPMLIQHGEDDHRVPLSNALELYRGLKEMKVPVELFIYPGMGHPITRPRENFAVLSQNLSWFSHYLLGEDLKLEP